MAISSMRMCVVVAGAGIFVLASFRLGVAVLHAWETGTVMLGDTRPSVPGRRGVVYPYFWREAWSYFAGWGVVAFGGLLLTVSSTARLWPLLASLLAFFVGFILIAAAPMLGSLQGILLFSTVFFGLSLLASIATVWLAGRNYRRVESLPEALDEARRENTR